MQFHLRIGRDALCKCGILGCGELGCAIARTLTQAELFSELVLWDPVPSFSDAEAQRIAAAHAFSPATDLYAGELSDLSDCALLILCEDLIPAGVGHRLGHTLFSAYVERAVAENRGAILLVAAADAEELTALAHRVSGFPAPRVLGSGRVAETVHLTHLLENRLGIDRRHIHAFVIGAAGADLLPVRSAAGAAGIDLSHLCEGIGRGYDPALSEGLCREVLRLFGAKKTPSCHRYAIADAVCRIADSIVRDRNEILTVCTPAEGSYGLEDVCLSLPCVIGHHGVKRILEIPLCEEEERRLRLLAARMRSSLRERESLR